MDVNEYITSGILEAYVLGGLSNKERQEVECMSSIYEEIGGELKKLQSGFEKAAQQNAVKPPEELKASIMDAIDKIQQDRIAEKDQGKETPIVSINRERSQRTFWRAAAIVFILVSSGLGYFYIEKDRELFAQGKKARMAYAFIKQQEEFLKDSRFKLNELSQLNALISNKETQQVVLSGSEIAPEASSRVYYNPSETQIAFQVDFLPETPSDKQYQLWAIVDGQPTDMGVLGLG